MDLFSGVGGMSLGFEQAGFDVVCAVEFDPAHAAAHRFNFPLCEVLQADATRLTVDELADGIKKGLERHGREHDSARVDVVIGGPPCQGFSVGGLMDPSDPRNELVEHFVRLAISVCPRAFVLENVPAMASRSLPSDERTVPDWIAARMRRAGYSVAQPQILNANRFGVPQDRRRLVMVGVETPTELPDAPKETHSPRAKRPFDTAKQVTEYELEPGPSVSDAIGEIPNLDAFDELLYSDAVRLPKDLRSTSATLASEYARRLSGSSIDATDLSRPRRRSPAVLSASLRTLHRDEVIQRFSKVKPGEREPISRFVRLHPDGLAPTLRAGSTPDRGSFSAPRPIHPEYNRVISVREAARLHGYPDWFRFSAAKWHGFRQVGNSVCPPFAKAVGESVRIALRLPAVSLTGTRMPLGDPELLKVPSGAGRSQARASKVQIPTKLERKAA